MEPIIKTTSLLERFRWERFERVIVLSPHLDDGALSCGGLLQALNGRIARLVITICCANPPPKGSDVSNGSMRSRQRKGHVSPKERRVEDVAAMQMMDCEYVQLGFADAVYRRSPITGQFTYSSVRDALTMPRVDDANFVEELYLILTRLCRHMGKTVLISPLGIGHHVDHVITSQVALRLVDRDTKLLFYEDFPYVWDRGASVGLEDDPERAMARLGVQPLRRWFAPYQPRRKEKLIKCYPTQVPLLFGEDKRLRQALKQREYLGQPAEFYWEGRPEEEALETVDMSHIE